jgi:hypothetical protein
LLHHIITENISENEQKKEFFKINSTNKKTVLPLRLQAYERMTIYLERIQPGTLINRCRKDGMTAADLHLSLLSTIRTEYDHNTAQQIYINEKTWEVIKISKEETIAIINNAAAGIPPKADGKDLSKSVLEQLMKFKERNLPTNKALRALKADMTQYF